jgi:hypothetical protein
LEFGKLAIPVYMHTQVNYDYTVILPIALVGGCGGKNIVSRDKKRPGKSDIF